MQATATKEHLSFQTEVKQLLNLMIHSLYSNKEIFLRELISNASDAADKLRFEGLTDGALYESDSDLKIRVSYDATARTITVADNGIGMSRQEVIDHIGTIAKVGYARILWFVNRRSGQGCALDRPVRCRLLFGVYRCRQGDAHYASCRIDFRTWCPLGIRW